MLRAQGREFATGAGVFVRREELTLEGKNLIGRNKHRLFQEASKDDTGFVLIRHFLQTLSILNSFTRTTIDEM